MGSTGSMKARCWMISSTSCRRIGVMSLLEEAHGAAIQREMLPFVQYVLLYGLKTLFGIESINALPSLLFSDEALMQLVGFNAQQVRQGICQRGATKRQGERLPGPICPDTLAKNIVKWNLRDLEMVFNGAIRALAKAGVFGARSPALRMARIWRRRSATRDVARSPARCASKIQRGQVHEIEVTVYGWKVLLLIDAATKIPLAVKVGQIQEHEALWARALVTQARMNLAGRCPAAQGGL